MLRIPDEGYTSHCRRLKEERRAGWLTRAEYDALRANADLNAAGNETPTAKQIAAEAGCSVRTVRRANKKARERGLLVVTPRFERHQQLANHYALRTPPWPVSFRLRLRLPRGCQRGTPIRQKVSQQEASRSDLLAARRLTIESPAWWARSKNP